MELQLMPKAAVRSAQATIDHNEDLTRKNMAYNSLQQ